MRVLEARFHPHKRNGTSAIVVGRVYCEGPRAIVQGVDAPGRVPGFVHDAMVEKLRYLVRSCGPRPYEGLRKLRSDYWSFIELSQGGES
jgi:hypothetical protein